MTSERRVPRDCYDACGALVRVATAASSTSAAIRTIPSAAASSAASARSPTTACSSTRPPRRHRSAGRGGEGRGSFEAVGWEQALELSSPTGWAIAAEDRARIVYSHYTGSFALLVVLLPDAADAPLGATEVAPDTICNDAGHTALGYMYGDVAGRLRSAHGRRTPGASSCGARTPRRRPPPARALARRGAGRGAWSWTRCAPPTAEPGRPAPAAVPGQRRRARLRADPRARPRRADRRGFLSAHTVGGSELLGRPRPAIRRGRGTDRRARGCVERAAHLYGAGPSLLWIGQGLQRQPRGGNVVRSVAALPAVTGNLGRAGAGFLYLNGFGNRGIDEDYLGALADYPDVPDARSRTWVLPTHLESPNVPRPSCAGTSTRWRRVRSRRACAGRSSARICSPWSPTCSQPTPSTSPTSCFRPRAGSSATTSSSPTSIARSRPRSRRPSRSGRRCPTARSSAAWRRAWGCTDPALLEPDEKIIAHVLEAHGDRPALRAAGEPGNRVDAGGRGPRCSSPTASYPTASGRHRARQCGRRGRRPRAPASPRRRRTPPARAAYDCSRRPRRGR